jgi:hypothetical protein
VVRALPLCVIAFTREQHCNVGQSRACLEDCGVQQVPVVASGSVLLVASRRARLRDNASVDPATLAAPAAPRSRVEPSASPAGVGYWSHRAPRSAS